MAAVNICCEFNPLIYMYQLIHSLKCVLNFTIEKAEVLGCRNGNGGGIGKNDHIFEPCVAPTFWSTGCIFRSLPGV